MRHSRSALGAGAALGLMLLLQLLALLLLTPFDESGYQAVDDPANPIYGAMFVVVILIATGFMLLAFKYDLQTVIRAAIIGIAGLLTWYVVAALTPAAVHIEIGGVVVDLLSIAVAVGVIAALVVHPEWYVIDASAVVIGAGAAALFGISFSILPIVILLVVLAIYDAISVYGTKHMLTLAEGAMSMQLPVLVVIPLSSGFSTQEMHQSEETPMTESEAADGPGATSMDAIFLGLGDLVIPSILIVSAAAQGVGDPIVTFGGIGLGLEVLGGMIGSLVGLALLMGMVFRGRAHAGLPLLNGGVLLGYLLGALGTGIGLSTALGL